MSPNASIHAILGAVSLCAVLIAQAAPAGAPPPVISGPVETDPYGGVLQSTLIPEGPEAPALPEPSPTPSSTPSAGQTPVEEAGPGAAIYSPFASLPRDHRSTPPVAATAAERSESTDLTLALTLSVAGVAALGCCWVVVGLRGDRGSGPSK
ncbi:hypothetical protein [Variovorax saccharolyticus]|uniref:hypothetical protein n=1 Tax=Variovorax saccharolyticus TaxID=3053516 RepID=UPI002577D024|nr:hypothetical protein [Variovorax sp. J22R187]MDM0020393.1 hypothetical protein [Variovorax sp. J22R187]